MSVMLLAAAVLCLWAGVKLLAEQVRRARHGPRPAQPSLADRVRPSAPRSSWVDDAEEWLRSQGD